MSFLSESALFPAVEIALFALRRIGQAFVVMYSSMCFLWWQLLYCAAMDIIIGVQSIALR
jgi:hypothetical protein